MHLEILKQSQQRILPLLSKFPKSFYMAGGTAVALHLGHRYSLDYDLFSGENISPSKIKHIIKQSNHKIQHVLYEDKDQISCIVDGVKLSFLYFPFPVKTELMLQDIISLPDLLTLAAMKAFALGGRGKWKDYVDLYFILKDRHSLLEIISRANQIFSSSFSEKLFLQHLAYYDDVSFAEEVEYLTSPVSEQEIQSFLTKQSIS